MRMLVKSILLLVFIVGCNGGNAQQSTKMGEVVLKGTVNFPQTGEIKVEAIINNQFAVVDTIELDENNAFSVLLDVPEPNLFRINFYNKQVAFLVLDQNHTVVTLEADGNNAEGKLEVDGSKDTDYLLEVQQIKKQLQSVTEELNSQFVAAQQSGDQALMQELQFQYQQKEAENNALIKNKISEMGTSLTALLVLQELDINSDFEFFDEIAEKFKQDLPNSVYTTNLVSMVDGVRKVSVGQMAPEISLNDPEGNLVSLSSLRGNYVMIDFWAAWCKPCRMENPNVVRLYNKYNDKGFEVFGVSLDRTHDAWVKAIEADGLNWTHVSDLQYFNSEAARLYNIQAIPATFLIDPDGKIIARNLRGVALQKKLEDLFDGA